MSVTKSKMDCHVLLAVHATNEVKTFRVDHEVSFFSRYFFFVSFYRARETTTRRRKEAPAAKAPVFPFSKLSGCAQNSIN